MSANALCDGKRDDAPLRLARDESPLHICVYYMCNVEFQLVIAVDFEVDEIGARLRAWRTNQGLSQSEVERRTGLAHNAISRIETGEVAPKLATLERIADALGISIEQLQFRYPPKKSFEVGQVPESDGIKRLMEMLSELPGDRRDQVVEMLVQVLQQVRR